MTQDSKLDRHDLKGPDELVLATGQVVGWLRAHQSQALGLAIGVAALVVVASVGLAYKGRLDEAARSEFDAAFRSYAALDFDKAQPAFLAFLVDHPSGELANLGRIYLGSTAAQRHDNAVAKTAFEGVLGGSPGPLESQLAHYNLGVILRDTGDREGAKVHFRAAGELAGPLQLPARIALASDATPGSEKAPAIAGLDRVPDEIVEYLDARSAKPG